MSATYLQVKESIRRRVKWMQSLKERPCDRCGSSPPSDQMHWHHRDPTEKLFTVAKGAYRVSRQRILAEIAKCDLLCEDCHRAIHRPDHGTKSRYNGGCRCAPCTEAAVEYVRIRRARRVVGGGGGI